MLATLTEELAAMGVELLVAHDVGQVRDTLRETGVEDAVGHHSYSTVDEAIEALADADPHRTAERSPAPGDAPCPVTLDGPRGRT